MFHKFSLSPFPLFVFLQTLSPMISAGVIASAGRTKQTIRWVDCHDRVPDSIAEELNFTSPTFPGALPSNLHCGEMDVPMDYTQPFNAITNNITIGFAMTRPAQTATGLILYHAGGPGENAAAEIWSSALNMSGVFEGLEDFDILGVNVRGIQFSNPLNLTTSVFDNASDVPFPSTQAEFDQYTAAMRNFYEAAIKDTTPPGIMQHLSTADVIQDWDSMRAALGYEKVSFAGISYGAFAGMSYTAKYPERVDRFVLDAVFPHGMPLQDLVTSQMAAVNRLVQRADDFCHTDPTCPFYGQGNGSVIQAWETVLARAIQSPLPAPNCGPGTGCNSPVTPSDLRQGANALLSTIPDFPLFSIGLNASLHGDASILAYRPDEDLRQTVLPSLLCSDLEIDDDLKTFAGFNNLSINSASSDPLHMIYSQMWLFILQCTVWPFSVDPSIARATLPTDLPLMWMTSDFDLNLPTELSTFAWQQAPKSTLVVRHGDDHTSILFPPPAAAAGDLARNFLRTGIMPKPSSNVKVTVIGPGGTRGPIPGAYDVPTGAAAGDMSSVENIM
ncbi:Alpha/Beta hydrolase protein [Mycena sanguinolenta]|nr:Alpha/Beta hydrolase protein [Mycena sanguinolenta]